MLRDIILFGVSVGVLCLYFAFLLYEWFLNKKKMRAETDKTYNFILPAAKRILSILQNRLHMELKEETLKRYRTLYVGKSDDDIKRDYYIKHISVFLYMLGICQVLFFVTLLSCQNDRELVCGYYMTIVTCILCRQIMTWMRTPADIFEDANTYIFIIFIGIPATYLYNLVSGIIRSLGDSRSPLFFLIVSSVLNIGLDFLFILTFHMGVAGAAWATVISQAVSGIGCLFYMKHKFEILKIRPEEWKMDTKYMKILCGMGIPMGLQYSITAIGSVILQTAVNTLGSSAVAAITAGSKVSMFFCCPYDAMGSTMATYAGQNVGAGKLDRVKKGMLSCCLLGLIYAVLAFVFLFFFGRYTALLFMEASEKAILGNVTTFLLINSAFFFPLSLVNIIRFTIQGMGYSVLAICAGICEMVARSIVGFVFVPMWGFVAACFASPVAWICADIFLIPAFFYCLRRLKKVY